MKEKKSILIKRFAVTNSIFSKTKTKSDMNQLVYICCICKTKCKEPVSRIGVNIVKVLCLLCIVGVNHCPSLWTNQNI